MVITAKQIADWAASVEAQRELPRLVRRLIHASASTTQIRMPAGDSVSQPGLDGELYSDAGNAWVPKGHSCWEMSCRADVAAKANEDYAKRTEAFATEHMAGRSYVAVTARKWLGRAQWAAARRAERHWVDVRAYDADDLEQWLEQSPSVAIAFGEELGIDGPGVTSLVANLRSWANQCAPSINVEALLAGRVRQAEQLRRDCEAASGANTPIPLALRADSVEEAVAFAAAALAAMPGLADRAVVVTDMSGWRFVEANRAVDIAVAIRPELADRPPRRDGLLLIIPYASGDMAKQFSGVAGRINGPGIELDRADHCDFEQALQQIGIDENDSRRLTDLCGRSWSVFRRQRAINPTIRRPAWLDHPGTPALATLCLIGTWSSDNRADLNAVASVAGRSYDALEHDLISFERLDDSPVLHIGSVWKAKSALELLSLYGDRITRAELERFFDEARVALTAPDPELELPPEERYAAATCGKVRPISGHLQKALCDTLVKLAVRGPEVPSLANFHIDARVSALVRELLYDADATRWLSLASQLPALAEASPDVFLTAVEASLAKPNAPVRQLLSETGLTGLFGSRCWHAGLLWALETLAWAPQRLVRVSLVLARLAETSIPGNWANKPSASLLSFYRSWFPQTAATIGQRIAALDQLIARAPDVAADLLDALTNTGHDAAHHNSRPDWRDDDAGVGYGATGEECHAMLVAAADWQLKLAAHSPAQVAKLVRRYSAFDDDRRANVLELLAGLEQASDVDKEIARAALRAKIHWHRNYDDDQQGVDALLAPLDRAYAALTPDCPVIANAWLFKDGWTDLPMRQRDEDVEEHSSLTRSARGEALAAIHAAEGWAGLVRLAEHAAGGGWVGQSVLDAGIAAADAIAWIANEAGDLVRGKQRTALAAGVLGALLRAQGHGVFDALLAVADACERTLKWKVQLLTFIPEEQALWDRVDALGAEAHALYWRTCPAFYPLEGMKLRFAVAQLLEAGRPVTAMRACRIHFEKVEPEQVLAMLEGMLKGIELDVEIPQPHYIQRAVDYVEQSGRIDRMRLAQIEFACVRALGFRGEHHAASLYYILMSQPALFVELICLIYNPRGGPPREPDEANSIAASNAYSVIHACKCQPGTTKDGSVTFESMVAYMEAVRQLAAAHDRLEACDLVLGEIMARSNPDSDGTFPGRPVRDTLEAMRSDELLRGFSIGCFNKRGIHSREMFDGGEQERALAGNYRAHAKHLEISHPHVAAALDTLARSYEQDGTRQDTRARLRRERL